MRAIILIELDEEHLIKQTNDLYDRLKGYKCELKPLPKELDLEDLHISLHEIDRRLGWNECLKVITGELE